jgi:hypothetical protein
LIIMPCPLPSIPSLVPYLDLKPPSLNPVPGSLPSIPSLVPYLDLKRMLVADSL